MENNLNQKTDHTKSTQNMLTGMFSDRESAEQAYKSLHSKGYTKDDVNLVMSDETREKHFSKDENTTELSNKVADDAGTGSLIGGTLGAIVGVLAAIGTSVLIPGLGLVIAGPIAAGLAGAGAGGITGGIIGALVGVGIPEERAKMYESGIKNGNIVMGVHPRNEEDATFLEKDWKENKGQDIYK
jgi:hypothetical protein